MKTTIDTLTNLQAKLSRTSAQINAIKRYDSQIANLIPQVTQLQSTMSAIYKQQSTINTVENINYQYLCAHQEFITQFTRNFEPLRQSILDFSEFSGIKSQIDLENIMKNISIADNYVYIQAPAVENLSIIINLPPAPNEPPKQSERRFSIYDFVKSILIPLLAIIVEFSPVPSQESSESFENHIREEVAVLRETIDHHNQILEELVQSLESLLEGQDKNAGCDCTHRCNDALK